MVVTCYNHAITVDDFKDLELKYLAEPKAKTYFESFAEAIRVAYGHSFGKTTDYQIAEIIGVSSGRVSQMLSSPDQIESVALKRLIDPIQDDQYKVEIIRHWVHAKFDLDILSQGQFQANDYIDGPESLGTLNRQSEYGNAYVTAMDAGKSAAKTNDQTKRNVLYEACMYSLNDIGMPGTAMRYALLITREGWAMRNPAREAFGHLSRARLLLTVPDTKPKDIQPIIATIEKLLDNSDQDLKDNLAFRVCTPRRLEWLKEEVQIEFMERGDFWINEDFLHDTIDSHLLRMKSLRRRFRIPHHILIARCYILLKDYLQAKEHLSLAYNVGKSPDPHIGFECGFYTALMNLHCESKMRASDYLTILGRSSHMTNADAIKYRSERLLAKFVSDNFDADWSE